MIAEPPFDAGALHESETCELPGVAITDVGAPGIVRGVIAREALDGADSPWTFIATTVKVYAVPLVSPVMVQVRAPVVVQLCPLFAVAR